MWAPRLLLLSMVLLAGLFCLQPREGSAFRSIKGAADLVEKCDLKTGNRRALLSGAPTLGPISSQCSSGAYVGPGDLGIPNIIAWSGFRAYSHAQSGTKSALIFRSSDSTEATINSLANGQFDFPTAQAFCLGTACTVVTAYDQSGGSNCSGVCDLTQATAANRPVLAYNGLSNVTSGPNYAPCAYASGGSIALASANNVTSQAQPFTLVVMARRTGNVTTAQSLYTTNSNNVGLYYDNIANTGEMSAGGTAQTFTVSDAAFHVLIGIFSGASSSLTVDGTTTNAAATPGSTAFVGKITAGKDFNTFNGTLCEASVYSGAMSSANMTLLTDNIRNYYGF